VPANEIVGLLPCELLVHRNVLNIVVHTDLNASPFRSTLSRCCGCATSSFCGHYGCGGVRAALQGARLGLIDNWLRHVQDVRVRYDDVVMAAGDEEQRLNRLCELTVIEQAVRVCETTILQSAWSEGHPVSVHGWIYTLDDGRLRDLGSCVLDAEQVEAERVEAVARVAHARTLGGALQSCDHGSRLAALHHASS
jgi:carbonic anhydrase